MSDECGRERSVGERSVRGVGVREVSEEWGERSVRGMGVGGGEELG